MLETAPKGTDWIEMSTLGRDDVLALAARAEAKGVRMLECPVTGGVHRAATGDITVLVGGDADLLEKHRPALGGDGRRDHPYGAAGFGGGDQGHHQHARLHPSRGGWRGA